MTPEETARVEIDAMLIASDFAVQDESVSLASSILGGADRFHNAANLQLLLFKLGIAKIARCPSVDVTLPRNK
jgi:hypothetical protein